MPSFEPVTSQSHNWLVHRIVQQSLASVAKEYATGRLVDIGCGRKPWFPLFEPYVQEYIGVDHATTLHDINYADVVADAYDTTLENASADTVVSLAVLEHLEHPQAAINEVARILAPGGYLILTTPLYWHLHEEPRDFYRYTKYGLKHLVETAGLSVVEIKPLSGFLVTFVQSLCYQILPFTHSRLLRPAGWIALQILQQFAYRLRRWDRDERFTWMYLVVAQSPMSERNTIV